MAILDEVKEWLEVYNEEDKPGALQCLATNGCISGMVSPLIAYTDTVAFFDRNIEEISELVVEMAESMGEKTLIQSLPDYEESDPFIRDTHNKNLLAWLAFEEVAYRHASEEYDI